MRVLLPILLQHFLLKKRKKRGHLRSWRLSHRQVLPSEMDFSKETSGEEGKRRSPVPKRNSKAPEQSERALPLAAPSIAGRGQLEPNRFWATASGSGPLLLSAEAGAAIPPFASTEERVAASAAPEKQAAKIFCFKSREMVPAHVWWDPTHPSLPGLGSSFLSCHPSQNFGARPRKAATAPQFLATAPGVGVSAAGGPGSLLVGRLQGQVIIPALRLRAANPYLAMGDALQLLKCTG